MGNKPSQPTVEPFLYLGVMLPNGRMVASFGKITRLQRTKACQPIWDWDKPTYTLQSLMSGGQQYYAFALNLDDNAIKNTTRTVFAYRPHPGEAIYILLNQAINPEVSNLATALERMQALFMRLGKPRKWSEDLSAALVYVGTLQQDPPPNASPKRPKPKKRKRKTNTNKRARGRGEEQATDTAETGIDQSEAQWSENGGESKGPDTSSFTYPSDHEDVFVEESQVDVSEAHLEDTGAVHVEMEVSGTDAMAHNGLADTSEAWPAAVWEEFNRHVPHGTMQVIASRVSGSQLVELLQQDDGKLARLVEELGLQPNEVRGLRTAAAALASVVDEVRAMDPWLVFETVKDTFVQLGYIFVYFKLPPEVRAFWGQLLKLFLFSLPWVDYAGWLVFSTTISFAALLAATFAYTIILAQYDPTKPQKATTGWRLRVQRTAGLVSTTATITIIEKTVGFFACRKMGGLSSTRACPNPVNPLIITLASLGGMFTLMSFIILCINLPLQKPTPANVFLGKDHPFVAEAWTRDVKHDPSALQFMFRGYRYRWYHYKLLLLPLKTLATLFTVLGSLVDHPAFYAAVALVISGKAAFALVRPFADQRVNHMHLAGVMQEAVVAWSGFFSRLGNVPLLWAIVINLSMAVYSLVVLVMVFEHQVRSLPGLNPPAAEKRNANVRGS